MVGGYGHSGLEDVTVDQVHSLAGLMLISFVVIIMNLWDLMGAINPSQ